LANSSWKVDPETRDYALTEHGDPVQDTSLLTPAYVRLMTKRTGWLYAPDTNYGSDYPALHIRVPDAATVISAGEVALQPLVDEDRATSFTVELTGSARGDLRLRTRIVDDEGRPQVFSFTPIVGG
jgi:phage gp46-like protein